MEFPAASGRLSPGFRFHPTDEELVMHYLKRKVLGKRLDPEFVAEVDIYKFHPEDLREMACLKKDLNWYFFCPKGKKYGCGVKTNRATQSGYWKGTGNGRAVIYRQRTVGEVKTLVFHLGKPPRGERTDWVMHEYRLEDSELATKGVPQGAFVLCKIFKKSGLGPRNGEQYGSPYIEEEWDLEVIPSNAPMVPVADQDQITSVNGSFSALVCPLQTSGAVSVSISDQAPTQTSNGSNVASTSKVVAPDTCDDVDQGPVPTSNVADIASSSMFPVQNDDDDIDIDILLSGFYADDFGSLYDNNGLGLSLKDLSAQ